MLSKTPPSRFRTVCPTSTADPVGSPGAAPWLHQPTTLGSCGGLSTRSWFVRMDTTGAATPISGMRRVYGPSRPSDLFVVRRLAALADPGEEVVVGVDPDGTGDAVGEAVVGAEPAAPAPVTSSPELQAATTATRASPAMNRAVP